jgi:hypothetical protein
MATSTNVLSEALGILKIKSALIFEERKEVL